MWTQSDRRAILIAGDSLAAFVGIVLAAFIRFGAEARSVWEEMLGLPPIWVVGVAFAAITIVAFTVAGVYRKAMYWSALTELTDLVKGWVLVVGVSLSLLYLLKLEDVSRVALAVAFSILLLAGIGIRLGVRASARRASKSGRALRHWVIAGNGRQVSEMVSFAQRHRNAGVRLEGIVTDWTPEGDVPWLGTLADLSEVLSTHIVDEVIVAFDAADWTKLEEVIARCTEQGKTVRTPITALAPAILRGRLEEFDGVPMWSVLMTPEHRVALAFKRLGDIFLSAFFVILLAPLLATTAVAVLIADGRPVLFKQARGGLNGRPFSMLKFRTMVNGAEALRAELAASNERSGPHFKLSHDPRVTRLGRWLRKLSIDELPQLFNVLIGQMSIVGPRPQPIDEVEAYDLWHRRRLSMRPGITGLWQVEARGEPSFDRWMDLDLAYIDSWSLFTDLRILLSTPAALIRTPGE